MKKLIRYAGLLLLTVILCGLVPGPGLLKASDDQARIIKPLAGELVKNRRYIEVEGSVGEYENGIAEGFHYWFSIAQANKGELGRRHWPKFYIKGADFKGRTSDEGYNPFPPPQPRMVLIIKVDAVVNHKIIEWLKRGEFEPRDPAEGQVIAKRLIYFP